MRRTHLLGLAFLLFALGACSGSGGRGSSGSDSGTGGASLDAGPDANHVADGSSVDAQDSGGGSGGANDASSGGTAGATTDAASSDTGSDATGSDASSDAATDAASTDAGDAVADAASTDAGDPAADGGACPVGSGTTHTGQATFYTPTNTNGCSIQTAETYGVAVPSSFTPGLCGACIQVDGPNGNVVARVMGVCPSCSSNDIDMYQAAYSQIGSLQAGVADVTWQKVECPAPQSAIIQLGTGINPWYVALTVEQNRTPVVSVELRSSGSTTWNAMTLASWGQYTFTSSTQLVVPVDVRVTDANGAVLTTSITAITDSATYTLGQFPSACP